MNLQFATHFPESKKGIAGKPTKFVEKIIQGLLEQEIKNGETMAPEWLKLNVSEHMEFCPEWDTGDLESKIHTIRKDSRGRWEPGKPIHFWSNFRTTDQFRFAPVIPLVSKQKIKIRWSDDVLMGVWIDDEKASLDKIETLAINDGFESSEDFFHWFDHNFDGWILHWTEFKY